jgi:hypothetical protein
LDFFPKKSHFPICTQLKTNKEKKESSVTIVDMKRKYNTESLQN